MSRGAAAFAFALTSALSGCGEIVHPVPPEELDNRLVMFAALNPDSVRHPVEVMPADGMTGRALLGLHLALFRGAPGPNGMEWTVAATWREASGERCGSAFHRQNAYCLMPAARLEAGAVYKVEASAEGRTVARGTTTLVGDFRVEAAEMSGEHGSRSIQASWTESAAAHRYLMGLRRQDTFCSNCIRAWYQDLDGTSYDGPVPQSAVDSAGREPMLDVMAVDKHLHAYLHSGHEGNFSTVLPVQNVEGGFGVVGSARYRSRKIKAKR